VRVEALTEEHLFSLESLDPELGLEEIVSEFGLVDYGTYIDRCTAAQASAGRFEPATSGHL
jgi:hypothetical protein